MQLTPAQLSDHIATHGLPVVLSVFGDAPLLVDDSLQQIRASARQLGVDERLRYVQDSQFEWRQLTDQSASLSLFSNHKLIELELPEAKPGREGGDALRRYLQAPPVDQTLVVLGPRLKQEQLKSKWYQELAAAGPVVLANNPERHALPAFIQQRAQHYGLPLAQEAIQRLALWFEGNLLALDQELQKLALIDLPHPITIEHIETIAQDQSRFNVFALQEAIVSGQLETALHRLQRLLEEDTEFAILNWMLQREWQLVMNLQQAENFEDACRKNGVWRNQINAYRQFCQRLAAPQVMARAAQLLAQLELAFKRDTGAQLATLATHLVTLYCQPQAVEHIPI